MYSYARPSRKVVLAWPFWIAAILVLIFALGVVWWAAILVTLLANFNLTLTYS